MCQLKYKYSVQILKEKGYYIKKNITNFYQINYINIIFREQAAIFVLCCNL